MENRIAMAHKNIPSREIFRSRQGGGEVLEGEDRKNKKYLRPSTYWGKLWNLYLFQWRQWSCLHTTVLPLSNYTLPCLDTVTTRPFTTSLEERHSLARILPYNSGLFNVRFKRFSPSLRGERGGGSVWLYLWPWQLFTSKDSWVTNI